VDAVKYFLEAFNLRDNWLGAWRGSDWPRVGLTKLSGGEAVELPKGSVEANDVTKTGLRTYFFERMIRRGEQAARFIHAALAEPRPRSLAAEFTEEGAKMTGRKLRVTGDRGQALTLG
jgi:hypothetical protein